MSEVKYTKNFVSLLNSLSIINKKFIIKKEDNKLKIDSKNDMSTIAYKFNCDLSHFNFEGDQIAFYNFSEFSDLFNVYKDALLTYNENSGMFQIFDADKKSKIKYYTSDPEIIPETFKKLKFDDYDYKFNLTSDDFVYIKKMISLIDAKKVKFIQKNGEFKIVLFSEEKDPTFEKTFILESSSEDNKDFCLVSPPDIFLFAPKNDYEIQIKEVGIFKFKYISDVFDLSLFCAINEE